MTSSPRRIAASVSATWRASRSPRVSRLPSAVSALVSERSPSRAGLPPRGPRGIAARAANPRLRTTSSSGSVRCGRVTRPSIAAHLEVRQVLAGQEPDEVRGRVDGFAVDQLHRSTLSGVRVSLRGAAARNVRFLSGRPTGRRQAPGTGGRTRPGFRMPSGSSAVLIERMTATAPGPRCSTRNSRRASPMPCSAVSVPPNSSAAAVELGPDRLGDLLGARIVALEDQVRVQVAVAGVTERPDADVVASADLLDATSISGTRLRGTPMSSIFTVPMPLERLVREAPGLPQQVALGRVGRADEQRRAGLLAGEHRAIELGLGRRRPAGPTR